jgi:hypothetical protein
MQRRLGFMQRPPHRHTATMPPPPKTPLTKLLLQAVDCCQLPRVDFTLPARTVAAQAAAAVARLAARLVGSQRRPGGVRSVWSQCGVSVESVWGQRGVHTGLPQHLGAPPLSFQRPGRPSHPQQSPHTQPRARPPAREARGLDLCEAHDAARRGRGGGHRYAACVSTWASEGSSEEGRGRGRAGAGA